MNGISVIAPLIFVIALGIALNKVNFITADDRARLIKLLYWVSLPALLFRNMYLAGGSIGQHANLFIAVYGPMLLTPLAALVLSALLLHRGDRNLQAASVLMSARANNLYLGLPAVVLAYGEEGGAAAALVLAVMMPGYNLISILCGEIVRTGRPSPGKMKSLLSSIIRNPLIASAILGLGAALVHLPVPDSMLSAMKIIGDIATGTALLALGGGLELANIPKAFVRTWHDSLIKLVLHPLITYILLTIWPVPPILAKAAVLISAMPVAVNTLIIAAGMEIGEQYVSETVAVSTILSAVSIPLWIAFMANFRF